MSVARNSKNRRPRGDGSVFYDEHRGRWVGSLDLGAGPDGKRRRVKVSADTESDAAQRLRDLRRQADSGVDLTFAAMTVSDLLTRWLADVAPNRQSPKTVEVNRSLIDNRLRPSLGAHKVKSLRPEHVEAFLADQARKGAARSTLVKMRSVLSQSLQWAEKRRVITWNPARLAEMPPTADTKPAREVHALDIDEARRLLVAAQGHRLECWLSLAITCGLRPGELGGLEWSAIDLDDGLLTVRQAMKWHLGRPSLGETKTGKVRTLALSAEHVELLRQHRRRQADERDVHGAWPAQWAGLVFTTENGTPIEGKNLRTMLARLAKLADVGPVTPYSLRHTACTILSAVGVRAELVADVLGHVDTRMVLRHYRHQTAPSVTAALPTAGRLLGATGSQ